jgi:hypothetical protein
MEFGEIFGSKQGLLPGPGKASLKGHQLSFLFSKTDDSAATDNNEIKPSTNLIKKILNGAI